MKKIYVLLIVSLAFLSCTTDTKTNETSDSLEFASKKSSNNVKLLKAWASNNSSPVQKRFVRKFLVEIKNLSFQKNVVVQQSLKSGLWVSIPLHFKMQKDTSFEVWRGEYILPANDFNDEFVIAYEVDGTTYYDNNNGKNYSLFQEDGAYLNPEIKVLADLEFTRFSGNYFNVNADAVFSNNSSVNVEVVYTTDQWVTTQTASLSFQPYFRTGYRNYLVSPNAFNIAKWETSIFFKEKVNTVEFALVYRNDGIEYWDNNFGKNYTLTHLDLESEGTKQLLL